MSFDKNTLPDLSQANSQVNDMVSDSRRKIPVQIYDTCPASISVTTELPMLELDILFTGKSRYMRQELSLFFLVLRFKSSSFNLPIKTEIQ